MTRKEDIIYLAGLFDGEGSVGIRRENPGEKRKSSTYDLEITITNTNKAVLLWAVDTFQVGYITVHHKQDDNSHISACWRWRVSCKKAAGLLKKLLPYLKIKKEVALLALEFDALPSGHCGIGRVSPELTKKREALKQKISATSTRNAWRTRGT